MIFLGETLRISCSQRSLGQWSLQKRTVLLQERTKLSGDQTQVVSALFTPFQEIHIDGRKTIPNLLDIVDVQQRSTIPRLQSHNSPYHFTPCWGRSTATNQWPSNALTPPQEPVETLKDVHHTAHHWWKLIFGFFGGHSGWWLQINIQINCDYCISLSMHDEP